MTGPAGWPAVWLEEFLACMIMKPAELWKSCNILHKWI